MSVGVSDQTSVKTHNECHVCIIHSLVGKNTIKVSIKPYISYFERRIQFVREHFNYGNLIVNLPTVWKKVKTNHNLWVYITIGAIFFSDSFPIHPLVYELIDFREKRLLIYA